MNKSLATFMVMAAVVSIMGFLVIGIAYHSLAERNQHHVDKIQQNHQVNFRQ